MCVYDMCMRCLRFVFVNFVCLVSLYGVHLIGLSVSFEYIVGLSCLCVVYLYFVCILCCRVVLPCCVFVNFMFAVFDDIVLFNCRCLFVGLHVRIACFLWLLYYTLSIVFDRCITLIICLRCMPVFVYLIWLYNCNAYLCYVDCIVWRRRVIVLFCLHCLLACSHVLVTLIIVLCCCIYVLCWFVCCCRVECVVLRTFAIYTVYVMCVIYLCCLCLLVMFVCIYMLYLFADLFSYAVLLCYFDLIVICSCAFALLCFIVHCVCMLCDVVSSG